MRCVRSENCGVRCVKMEMQNGIEPKTKKAPNFWRLYRNLAQENYFLNLAYLFLNLSIRPAVSNNLDFPV